MPSTESLPMKIQSLFIAAALATGAAVAATPNDTAKAPDTDTAATAKPAVKHHKKTKVAKKHHAAKPVAAKQGDAKEAVAAPQVNLNDNGRDARMEEALTKYRQSHG